VSHADVQAWITALSVTRSPSTVRKVHQVLSLILDPAVRDGRLARNVAEKINLPRPVRHDQRHLTVTQVEAWPPSAATPRRSASTGRWPNASARPTGSSCSSSPTPASGSGRWPP
jgi:hypothetical protein